MSIPVAHINRCGRPRQFQNFFVINIGLFKVDAEASAYQGRFTRQKKRRGSTCHKASGYASIGRKRKLMTVKAILTHFLFIGIVLAALDGQGGFRLDFKLVVAACFSRHINRADAGFTTVHKYGHPRLFGSKCCDIYCVKEVGREYF